MGCDIHLYIEHKSVDVEWWSCFAGRINPGRHYGIFAKLVGVRNYDGYGISPISEPRGLPKDVSWDTKGDALLYITNTEGDGYCSKENADRWVKQGCSEKVDEHHVTHPDWHSHSWSSIEELESVFSDKKVGFDIKSKAEWVAVLECMKCFKKLGQETRIVFWFDN